MSAANLLFAVLRLPECLALTLGSLRRADLKALRLTAKTFAEYIALNSNLFSRPKPDTATTALALFMDQLLVSSDIVTKSNIQTIEQLSRTNSNEIETDSDADSETSEHYEYDEPAGAVPIDQARDLPVVHLENLDLLYAGQDWGCDGGLLRFWIDGWEAIKLGFLDDEDE
ncbi:hypothetical protein BJY04DRAFT_221441 [Aspergillus karnatakaensis]|uniref:uncharacterized protein n=1 Tax=Aspergillus karnatakaensis TaxID=1810916 RepID=UPI003CCD25B9